MVMGRFRWNRRGLLVGEQGLLGHCSAGWMGGPLEMGNAIEEQKEQTS